MDNPDRFCMFPVKYQQIWEMYKKAEASFWTGERGLKSACAECRLEYDLLACRARRQ